MKVTAHLRGARSVCSAGTRFLRIRGVLGESHARRTSVRSGAAPDSSLRRRRGRVMRAAWWRSARMGSRLGASARTSRTPRATSARISRRTRTRLTMCAGGCVPRTTRRTRGDGVCGVQDVVRGGNVPVRGVHERGGAGVPCVHGCACKRSVHERGVGRCGRLRVCVRGGAVLQRRHEPVPGVHCSRGLCGGAGCVWSVRECD